MNCPICRGVGMVRHPDIEIGHEVCPHCHPPDPRCPTCHGYGIVRVPGTDVVQDCPACRRTRPDESDDDFVGCLVVLFFVAAATTAVTLAFVLPDPW